MVWSAMNEASDTLNSSSLNSIPSSPRVTMSRKSTTQELGRERGEPPSANGVGREGAVGPGYLELGGALVEAGSGDDVVLRFSLIASYRPLHHELHGSDGHIEEGAHPCYQEDHGPQLSGGIEGANLSVADRGQGDHGHVQGIGELQASNMMYPNTPTAVIIPSAKSAFRIRRVATRGSYTVLSETARPS
jgi:hypothetical protein